MIFNAAEKADAFADTFATQNHMIPLENNEYSFCATTESKSQGDGSFIVPSRAQIQEVLQNVREGSATGPDLLPVRILRECAKELAELVQCVIESILRTGIWPDSWKQHRIVPLYKKNAPSNPENYRGVHITSQLSKVVERSLAIYLCRT